MRPKPYLFFDAGGTLVFPDQTFLIREASVRGIHLAHEQLFAGYYRLIYHLDQQARRQGYLPDNPWPRGYAYALFETLSMLNSVTRAVARAAEKRHGCRNLWTFTFDWVPAALSTLAAQGYRMSVISNSDGRTEQVFRELGLRHYFDCIFDSALMGVSKPNRAIFKKALEELDLRAEDSIFVGDMYEIDVQGANQAGLQALHIDPLGLYTSWPGVHLPCVGHLSGWLTQHIVSPQALDPFSARNKKPEFGYILWDQDSFGEWLPRSIHESAMAAMLYSQPLTSVSMTPMPKVSAQNP